MCLSFLDHISVVEEVIRYLYTGVVRIAPSTITGLLNAAELFVIDCLSRDILETVQYKMEVNKVPCSHLSGYLLYVIIVSWRNRAP